MFDFATSMYGTGERQQYPNFSTATTQLDMPSLSSPVVTVSSSTSMCQRPSSATFLDSSAATDKTMVDGVTDRAAMSRNGRKRAVAPSEACESNKQKIRFVARSGETKQSSRGANQQLRERKFEAANAKSQPRRSATVTPSSTPLTKIAPTSSVGAIASSVPRASDEGAATVIRSFHDFGLMLNLYGLTTQEDRDHIAAKLSSKLTDAERRFCNGDDVQRKRVREVFQTLCFGLDVNPDRAKYRLIDHLRNSDFSIPSPQQQPVTEKIMLKYIDLWYDYATETSCEWKDITAEDIDETMRSDEARPFTLHRACRSCIRHFIRLNQYGRLCPRLVRCVNREAFQIDNDRDIGRTREKPTENKAAKLIARPSKMEDATMPQKLRQKLPPSSFGRPENFRSSVNGATQPIESTSVKLAPFSSSGSGGKNLAALLRHREAAVSDVTDEGYDDNERFMNEIDEIINMHTVPTNSANRQNVAPVDDDEDFEDCEAEEEEEDDNDEENDEEDDDFEENFAVAPVKASFRKKK